MTIKALPAVRNTYGSTTVNDAVTGLVWEEQNEGRARAGVLYSGFVEIIINGETYRQRISLWDRGMSRTNQKQIGISADLPQAVDSIVEGRSREELEALKRRIEAQLADEPVQAPLDANGDIDF